MIPDAYKHYRIHVTKAIASSGYTCINEFRLYESLNYTSENLCIGAITTADSQSNSTTHKATNATDGDQSTAWESNNNMGSGHWLAVELPEPKVIRSVSLNSAKYQGEGAGDFTIQGSHDGVSWDILYTETGNTNHVIDRNISYHVSGVSKLDTGERTVAVLVYDWETGALKGKLTPKESGEWFLSTLSVDEVFVTHIGPSGFEPKTDGPITPYTW